MSHEIKAVHKGKIQLTGQKYFKSGVLNLYERTLTLQVGFPSPNGIKSMEVVVDDIEQFDVNGFSSFAILKDGVGIALGGKDFSLDDVFTIAGVADENPIALPHTASVGAVAAKPMSVEEILDYARKKIQQKVRDRSTAGILASSRRPSPLERAREMFDISRQEEGKSPEKKTGWLSGPITSLSAAIVFGVAGVSLLAFGANNPVETPSAVKFVFSHCLIVFSIFLMIRSVGKRKA
jgi:hypothetical protein